MLRQDPDPASSGRRGPPAAASLHVRDLGNRSRRTVLLLHGCLGDSDDFDAMAARLAATRRVLVPDLPGHGRSPPLRLYSFDGVREVVEKMLMARGAPGLDIVGYGYGAYHALLLVLLGRVKVGRLHLIGPVAAGLDEASRAAMAVHAENVRSGRSEYAASFVARCFGGGWAAAHAEVVARVHARAHHVAREQLARELEEFARLPDLRRRLPAVACHTVVRVGAEDALTRPQAGESIARAIPGARLELVAGAGHALMLEDFEGTLASVEQLLAR